MGSQFGVSLINITFPKVCGKIGIKVTAIHLIILHMVKIYRVYPNEIKESFDELAIEAPLQISIGLPDKNDNYVSKDISITMRTPGQDKELALGFLFTENLIKGIHQVTNISEVDSKIELSLSSKFNYGLEKLERHFYTSSSCGVCGKSSIDAITIEPWIENAEKDLNVNADVIFSLPKKLHEQQMAFQKTGGIHASALFTSEGKFITHFDDVGRHNALDKLIGHFVNKEELPLSNEILLLSGRASFELIQKSAMAGVNIVVAIGAPSSLAVQLAESFGMTLIGFTKDSRFNIYCGKHRIQN